MGNFDRVFDIVVGHEGGFTANPADCGNWTGGVIGTGTCRGTRFGISAAAYPDLDIANLSLDAAKALTSETIGSGSPAIACRLRSLSWCSTLPSTTVPVAQYAGCNRSSRYCRMA
jgi:hypothetical protein